MQKSVTVTILCLPPPPHAHTSYPQAGLGQLFSVKKLYASHYHSLGLDVVPECTVSLLWDSQVWRQVSYSIHGHLVLLLLFLSLQLVKRWPFQFSSPSRLCSVHRRVHKVGRMDACAITQCGHTVHSIHMHTLTPYVTVCEW